MDRALSATRVAAVPPSGSLAIYIPLAVMMAFTPGPATLFVLSRASLYGSRAGLVSAAGLLSGTLVLVTFAAIGLTALLAVSAVTFEAVKTAGALYLAYLGLRTIMMAGGSLGDSGTTRVRSAWLLYREGVVTELLNPKAAFFYASVLPQFVDKERPDVPFQMLVLGVVFVVFGSVALTLIAICAAAVKARLVGNRVWRLAVGWASGLILVGLGVRLAISKAR